MAGPNLEWVTSWQLWFWAAILLFIFFVGYTIIFIIIARKTHAMIEFKAWRKGIPIAMFYQDSGYCEWKAIKPEALIIQDDDYGTYLIQETGTYIDRRTKNILIPFDANLATSINVSAAKLADDLKFIFKDTKQMEQLREAVLMGQIKEDETISALKTSVQFSSIKSMLNALIPHNISAKIEKMIAARMKGRYNVNVVQIILIFVAIFGAIVLGAIVLKSVLGGNTAQVVQNVAPVAKSIASSIATSTPTPVATAVLNATLV
jgi:hypothetical protein